MTPDSSDDLAHHAALDRARSKAYWRLLPLLFLSYLVAYVDRQNVAVAKLNMTRDLPGFDNGVIGLGAGIFFVGYFLLEVPGTLMVERWSARKWICRIMVTWGLMAGLTAAVKTPWHFYTVRFFLGLAEAGFFPGVVVYLTHWFPNRDRARALATFLVASPFAQIVSPKISNWLLTIGAPEKLEPLSTFHPLLQGLVTFLRWLHELMGSTGITGWQWVYIVWGVPAVILGTMVFFWLVDKPSQARWLTDEEACALESELEKERAATRRGKRMTVLEALQHPRVLMLALAYFCTVTGSYGIEFFMPSILKSWYEMDMNKLTWLIMLPPAVAMVGQLFTGWSSDRLKERRWHAVTPILTGSLALGLMPQTQGHQWLTVICLAVAFAGFKSYMPAFWALPSMFLTESAAAGSIGLINSVGNLGGFLGPNVMGWVEKFTGSFVGGLYYLCISMLASASIIFFLGLGKRSQPES